MIRPIRPLMLLGATTVLSAPTAIGLAAGSELPANASELRATLAGSATVRAQMRGHQHIRMLARYRHAARRAGGRPAAEARFWSNGRLRDEVRTLRAQWRAERASAGVGAAAGAVAPTGHLAAIAQCESGGNPHAVGGGGRYRGLYQFSYATWQAVGGSGDPAAAPVAEQTRRAQILYAQSGAGQWPVCGS
jgi:hypothetical protein